MWLCSVALSLCLAVDMAGEWAEEEEELKVVRVGSYGGMVRIVEESTEETMLLWGIQQPTLSQHNAFVSQSSLSLHLDACGHSLSLLQSPSSLAMIHLQRCTVSDKIAPMHVICSSYGTELQITWPQVFAMMSKEVRKERRTESHTSELLHTL